MTPTPRRRALALSIALILAAALPPVTTRLSDATKLALVLCVICGDRGTADAILNVLLFVPLGAALALGSLSGPRALGVPASLSAGLEIVQLAIPGRHPSAADVIFNVIGAALGLLLVRYGKGLFDPHARWAPGESLVAACLAVGVFGLTGVLLAPAFPLSSYEARWTPTVNVDEPYRGTVFAAAAGREPLPPGPLARSAAITAELRQGEPVRVAVIAGPQTRRMAPIVGVYDDRLRQIAIVAADGGDLVWRYRTRAHALLLDQPDLRIHGALSESGVRVRDTLQLAVRRRPTGWTAEVGGRRYDAGFTIGSGWALLLPWKDLPPVAETFLGCCWIAALIVPLGYWTRRRWESLVGIGLAVWGLALLPAIVGLMPTRPSEALGAVAGLLVGSQLGRARGNRSA